MCIRDRDKIDLFFLLEFSPNRSERRAQYYCSHNRRRGDEMCIRDRYNDTEMLQFAGISYAMSGGAPGISYYSTYVTDSVEEVLVDLAASV